MARLQLIFPILFWAIWRETASSEDAQLVGPGVGVILYLSALVLLVGFVHLVSWQTMRRTTYDRPIAVPRFHRTLFTARWMILALHAFALWSLSWGEAVLGLVSDHGGRFQSLPTFISILPVLAAWMGLIWAQYPLDRAVREQNALWALELGEPVRSPPTLRVYMGHAVRSQILFTLTPLMAIWVLRDGLHYLSRETGLLGSSGADLAVTGIAVAVVFTLAPELLRRVLPTEPLPPSPVRERLENLSSDLNLGVREILLWHTHHAIGNAAVMGVLPRVRYVLITDLLLETMTPDQIEAVFAHEAGHVKYRHMAWYAGFWVTMIVTMSLAVDFLVGRPEVLRWAGPQTVDSVVSIVGLLLTLVLFGLLSRRFERQADAFAARRLTRPASENQPARNGTLVFNSALGHVARLNNLPLDHHSLTAGRPWVGRVIGRIMHHAATWMHGSIRSRMNHLNKLAESPAAALRFDQLMYYVRVVLVVAFVASVSGAIASTIRQRKEELDLDRGVQWQRIDPDGRPGVPAGVAKNLD